MDTIDSLHANLVYTDGGHGFFESHWILPTGLTQVFGMKLDIVGTTGSIHLDTHYQALRVVTDRTRHPGTYHIEVNGRLLGQTAFPCAWTPEALRKALRQGLDCGAGGALTAVGQGTRRLGSAPDRRATGEASLP